MKALLLSGGIESTCLAYWKRPDLCITIDYGQVCATTEIEISSAICERLNLDHKIIKASAGSKFGLLGRKKPANPEKPEYWPYRNQFLATVAAMAVQEKGIREIWFGAVRSDKKFLDGTAAFYKKLDALISMQEGNIRIKAPAIALSTEELIVLSRSPRAILGATFSCHRSSLPCGDCPGCWKQFRLLYSGGRARSGPLRKRDLTITREASF
jgi:7-cyano-7-deazaguanine synthase